MKITWLGTGNAFTLENFQTNALIEFDRGYKLLIDCGGDIRFSLAAQGLSYLDINGVYISHLHADHIGGLEYLAFSSYFDPRYKGRPDMFISEFMVDALWERGLSAGLASLQVKRATLDTYFDVHVIERNQSFVIPSEASCPNFRLIQMIHFVNAFTFEPSFGLMFRASTDEKVFLTTDTQHAPNQIRDFYNEAAIIFHDVETLPFKSGVHAHFEELCELNSDTKGKMRLVHYHDNIIKEWEEWQEKAVEAGFWGFVGKGATFEF